MHHRRHRKAQPTHATDVESSCILPDEMLQHIFQSIAFYDGVTHRAVSRSCKQFHAIYLSTPVLQAAARRALIAFGTALFPIFGKTAIDSSSLTVYQYSQREWVSYASIPWGDSLLFQARQDTRGHIWMLSRSGVLHRYRPSRNELLRIADSRFPPSSINWFLCIRDRFYIISNGHLFSVAFSSDGPIFASPADQWVDHGAVYSDAYCLESAEVIDDCIYLAVNSRSKTVLHCYDTARQTLREVCNTVWLDQFQMCACDRILYFTGAMSSPRALKSFDPATSKWRQKLTPVPTGRKFHTLVAAWGRLYAIGGLHADAVCTVESYDPRENQWRKETATPHAMLNCQAILLMDS
eukprot:TRINITY_DN5495_c0_g1_i1.p1 TRINITY_DN5495_c0_g1~~TRINITY_DN5495_c0_g1_i1.p1  ORF type:complete len:352 (+),score=29.06 TRINITY_DN5495_c0_g1_i1:1195-2250(+)